VSLGDPYRGVALPCPVCGLAMREFHARLVCDSCDGMMLALDDLRRAVGEITGAADPVIELLEVAPGTHACPRCARVMDRARLRIRFDDAVAKAKVEIGCCPDHGLWFERGTLPTVFEKVNAKASPRGVLASYKFELHRGRGKPR
jgi:Zn-finger nucleic acid-binding protein